MFLDPAEYPVTRHLEAHFEVVREELSGIDLQAFEPWFHREAFGGGWKVFPIVLGNADVFDARELVAACAQRCPRTTAMLECIPGILLGGFPMLEPGTHVYLHTDASDPPRYRCHLPLAVPPGSRFRMGDETRDWEVGKAIIFDGNTQHETANTGDEPRIVLVVDVPRSRAREAVGRGS